MAVLGGGALSDERGISAVCRAGVHRSCDLTSLFLGARAQEIELGLINEICLFAQGGGHAPRVWVVAPASAAKHIPPVSPLPALGNVLGTLACVS